MKFEGFRIVAHELGALLMIVALVPVGALPVAFSAGETRGVIACLVTSSLFLATGLLLRQVRRRREPTQRHAMMIAAVGWLLVPFLSVPPLVLLEGMTLLDAYFEMMSGWSGTGLSLLDVTTATATTLWWRSLVQWVGGVGVIVLTITILARPGSAAFALYKGEGREEKLRPNVVSTVRTIWWIYALYTGGIIVALSLAGRDLWDAANHALTAISTAGFSVYPDSLAGYDAAAQLVMVLAMIAGATPFIAHYALIKGDVRKFWADVQVRWMLAVIALGTLGAVLAILVLLEPRDAWLFGLFQWASAVSSTGFQTYPSLGDWPASAKLFLALGMIVGGSAGSTAGGIKIVRAALLARGVGWKIRRASLPPFAVATFRFGRRNLRADEANQEFAEAAFVTFLWVIAVHLLLFSLLSIGVPVEDAIFESASVISNNGMSVGVTDATLPPWVKGVFMLSMWAGRLEIFPVLILLRAALQRPGAPS